MDEIYYVFPQEGEKHQKMIESRLGMLKKDTAFKQWKNPSGEIVGDFVWEVDKYILDLFLSDLRYGVTYEVYVTNKSDPNLLEPWIPSPKDQLVA